MAKLKNESAPNEEVPSGVTTIKEQSLVETVTNLQVEIIEANRKILQLTQAADPNRLHAVRQKDRKDYAHFKVGIPSLDGKDPIVGWKGFGSVTFRQGIENDTQTIEYTTLSGKSGEIPYLTIIQEIAKNSMVGLTQNLRAITDRDGFRRHEEKRNDELVDVMVSDDNGESYTIPVTIPYGFLNMGRIGGTEDEI